ncbi:MAG: hypothetical protein EP330_22275 [Deltaproteobacteria bacterium]|nr:MAG: hypothetical protein EP330_22275 [Deltaproteobacteria bacterium]
MHKLISVAFVALSLSACGTEQAPTLTYGDADLRQGGPVDCSTVYCFAVECPEGFERVYNGPNDCCGTCKEVKPSGAGQCNNVRQCENDADLVRLACVGSWDCVDNACVYTCDTSDTGLVAY